MKVLKMPFAFIAFMARTTGIICCLCAISISNAVKAALMKTKRLEKSHHRNLDIDFIQLPELGKKLQQSFK